MAGEVKIQNDANREKLVSILAHEGYMVWIERKFDSNSNAKYYVCWKEKYEEMK